mmetsp:Transcript_21258/g.59406  ORF Transcript_21258/g.59406 Transcript_21258/m.59406 type:complete len:228 (+) Transcript_21258:3-686(+)
MAAAAEPETSCKAPVEGDRPRGWAATWCPPKAAKACPAKPIPPPRVIDEGAGNMVTLPAGDRVRACSSAGPGEAARGPGPGGVLLPEAQPGAGECALKAPATPTPPVMPANAAAAAMASTWSICRSRVSTLASCRRYVASETSWPSSSPSSSSDLPFDFERRRRFAPDCLARTQSSSPFQNRLARTPSTSYSPCRTRRMLRRAETSKLRATSSCNNATSIASCESAS